MPVYSNSDYVNVVRPVPSNWKKDRFGIPLIRKETLPISQIGSGLFLISPRNVSARDTDKGRKIVHSFRYDKELRWQYEHPMRYLERIRGYYGTTSPDFSMHPGMQEWLIISSVAESRWLGRYLQSMGVRVYPTVGWIDEDTYDICFAGLEDGSCFFVSTLGVNNDESRPSFLKGLYELRRRFPHSRQICVGQRIEGIPDDVCIVPYEESFGGKRQMSDRNRIPLFNWDGTPTKEVK